LYHGEGTLRYADGRIEKGLWYEGSLQLDADFNTNNTLYTDFVDDFSDDDLQDHHYKDDDILDNYFPPTQQ
jgi:hypothetical protein